MLTGDYSDIGDIQEDDYQQEEDDAEEVVKDSTIAPRGKRDVDFESDGVKVQIREKRSTMVIVTRDDVTNSTTIREFAFQNVNTTERCVTLSDLRSSTRYIVYVTARNEYGTSVPSVRNIASTNVHMVKNNASLPDSMSKYSFKFLSRSS